MAKAPYLFRDNAQAGFDAGYMGAGNIPGGDIICALAQAPEGTGQDPMAAWGGIVDKINQRIVADYIVDNDGDVTVFVGGLSDSFGPMVIPRLPSEEVFTTPQKIWSTRDIIRARHTLRGINAAVVFPRMGEKWAGNDVRSLLLQRWARLGPVEGTFNVENAPIFVDPWVYVIDMEDGLGPRSYYYPGLMFPIPGGQLLSRWAAEDTIPGHNFVSRGHVLVEGITQMGTKYPDKPIWVAGTYDSIDGDGTKVTLPCKYIKERKKSSDDGGTKPPDDNGGGGDHHGYDLTIIGALVVTVLQPRWSPSGDILVANSNGGATGYISAVGPSNPIVIHFNTLAEAQARLAELQIGDPSPGSSIGIVGTGSGWDVSASIS